MCLQSNIFSSTTITIPLIQRSCRLTSKDLRLPPCQLADQEKLPSISPSKLEHQALLKRQRGLSPNQKISPEEQSARPDSSTVIMNSYALYSNSACTSCSSDELLQLESVSAFEDLNDRVDPIAITSSRSKDSVVTASTNSHSDGTIYEIRG